MSVKVIVLRYARPGNSGIYERLDIFGRGGEGGILLIWRRGRVSNTLKAARSFPFGHPLLSPPMPADLMPFLLALWLSIAELHLFASRELSSGCRE